MIKIITHEVGDFKGTLYYTENMGYTYKIKYNKEIVGQSYVYLADKYYALNKMKDDMKVLAGFNHDLFDLERL